MAQGRSPPPEIRSPDERGAAEGAAEAEAEEEVFDDAFDIPHKNAPHDRLRRWRVRAIVSLIWLPFFPSNLDLRLSGSVGDLGCVMRVVSSDLEMITDLVVCMPYSVCFRMLGE